MTDSEFDWIDDTAFIASGPLMTVAIDAMVNELALETLLEIFAAQPAEIL